MPHQDSSGAANLSSASHALERSLRSVRREQARAVEALETKPIHDLRVALRRCRSLAEGFSELNPHPDWRHLRKACKDLLDGIAALRDAQVVDEWALRLGFQKGALGATLKSSLEREQDQARRSAHLALTKFSCKRWKRWRRRLPERAARISSPETLFARLALKRLLRARELETRWSKSNSRLAAHRLRVALKRFRYTLESFLPGLAAWSSDLKQLQDFLGDVHDLDVLRRRQIAMLRAYAAPRKLREEQLAKIEKVGSRAVKKYWKALVLKPASRQPGAPPRSLWDRWEKRLRKLAGVTFRVPEGPWPSAAKPGSPAPGKSSRYPNKPHQPSAGK